MGTKHREGRLAHVAGARMGAWITRMTGAAMFAVLLLVGLTGCVLNAAVTSPTPISTANRNSTGTPGAHPTLTLPTPSAAASPSGTSGQQGAKEFCSKAPSVTIQPGKNVPVYPGAALHFSQTNNNNAFFGYCSSASTSAVQDFYAQRLRSSGWTSLQTSTISAVVQITALQCATAGAPEIIVTIAPDTTGTTTTSISIVVLDGTC